MHINFYVHFFPLAALAYESRLVQIDIYYSDLFAPVSHGLLALYGYSFLSIKAWPVSQLYDNSNIYTRIYSYVHTIYVLPFSR